MEKIMKEKIKYLDELILEAEKKIKYLNATAYEKFMPQDKNSIKDNVGLFKYMSEIHGKVFSNFLKERVKN